MDIMDLIWWCYFMLLWLEATQVISFTFVSQHCFCRRLPVLSYRDLWRRRARSAPPDYNTAKAEELGVLTCFAHISSWSQRLENLQISFFSSFFKNLIWPVPKFHCTESVKISIVHGPKELTWKAKTVTLSRRDDMNLESIIFKAHAAMLFAFCSVHLHLNYILHHGSKLKPQLVSLQNMQFLTSCKEDFNNQHPMFMAFLQGSMDVPTSKNPAMNAMFTMSSCIYPNFLLGLGNGNIQSPARVAIKKPPRLSFTGTAHSHHPSCQANNRASWGRDAS